MVGTPQRDSRRERRRDGRAGRTLSPEAPRKARDSGWDRSGGRAAPRRPPRVSGGGVGGSLGPADGAAADGPGLDVSAAADVQLDGAEGALVALQGHAQGAPEALGGVEVEDEPLRDLQFLAA